MPLTEEEMSFLSSELGPTDRVRPSMEQAFRRDPDQYAEALRLSKKQGVPADTVERNIDEVKRRDKLQMIDLEGLRKNTPSLTEYLSNPDNASVSSDDVDNLKRTEEAITNYKRPWWDIRSESLDNMGERLAESFKQMKRGADLGQLDALANFQKSMEAMPDKRTDPETLRLVEESRQQVKTQRDETLSAFQAGEKKIEDLSPKGMTEAEQALNSAVQSFTQQFLPMAMTLATKNPAWSLGGMAAMIAPEKYGAGRSEGLAPLEAGLYSAEQTGVNVVTEMIPAGKLAKMAGGSKMGKNAIDFAVSELFGEQLATLGETGSDLLHGLDKQLSDPNLTTEQKVDIQLNRQFVTLIATVMGGSMQTGAAGTVGYLAGAADRKINGDIRKVSNSLSEQNLIDTAITLSQESNTRARAPEQYSQFLKAVGGDTTVTIPADALPADGTIELPEYLTPGQDNEVGLELFMRDIAPNEELIAQIRPHIKLDTTSYSQTEMERDDRADVRKIMEKAVKNQETLTEAQQIWETVKDQLVATERQGENTARLSAQLYPAFATVMSEKLRSRGHDISPAQVFADMGFKVEGPGQQEQTVVDETVTPSPLSEIPESLIAEFPDFQLTEQGYIPIDNLKPEEQNALESAGIVEDISTSDGESYRAVNPEHLWEERKRRQATPKQQEPVDVEERNAAIERRAQFYDRIANEQEEAGDTDLAEETRSRAAEIRQRKTEAPLAQSPQPTPKDGRDFRNFFSSVVTGMAGKSDTGVPYETVIQGREDLGEFAQEYADHRGNFDDHIAFSIPGFKEVQMAVGNAVVNTYGEDAVLLDIGASEGSFGKSITALGGPQTVSFDPNPDMKAAFDSNPVPGATYELAAFSSAQDQGVELWDEAGVPIVGFTPTQQFDVVHEAMVFQFIENDRPSQISRMKEMMKDDGVLIIEEKFKNDQWVENEARKDEVKRKYFQPKDMTEKAKAVLEGMNENMTSDVAIEELLGNQFKHVVQFWDSGNFKGYMASDSQDRLATMVDAVGDLRSDHAAIETPRIVEKETVTLPVETVETGEMTEETFAVKEISSEINDKLEAYQQLLDCLRS